MTLVGYDIATAEDKKTAERPYAVQQYDWEKAAPQRDADRRFDNRMTVVASFVLAFGLAASHYVMNEKDKQKSDYGRVMAAHAQALAAKQMVKAERVGAKLAERESDVSSQTSQIAFYKADGSCLSPETSDKNCVMQESPFQFSSNDAPMASPSYVVGK